MEPIKKQFKPRSHYTLVRNSLIKIAGYCYYKNQYHIFDLHSPFSKEENFYVVGHGISDDTLVFKNACDAIYPTLKLDRDGIEDCTALVIRDRIYLFYIANRYSRKDERNLHIHDLTSVENTAVICCFSEDGINFDNTNDKHVLLDEHDIEAADFEKGTIEAISAFDYENEVYIVLVGFNVKTNLRTIATYHFDINHNKVEFLGSCPFLESKYRVTSLSINRIRETNISSVMITCSVSKDNRSGAYMISRDLASYSRSYCVMADFNPQLGEFTYDLSTKSRFDCSEDMTSIKVQYDSRDRLIAFGCIPTDVQIKDADGMLTAPRRITFDDRGKFSFSVHPLMDMRIINEVNELRLKQTHYPEKIMFSLKPFQSVSVGSVDIYTDENTLYIDRTRSLNKETAFYKRRRIYEFETKGKMISVVCFIDQELCELILNNNTFVTLVTENMTNMVKPSDDVKIVIYSMNQVRNR